MSVAGAKVPIAVYRGRGIGIAAIQAYEAWLGRAVTYVEDFMVEAPSSWAQFETGALTTTTTVTAWGNSQLGARKLVLGVPACCMGTTWAQEAAGVNDAHWTALGNALVAAGLGNSTLRIAREFNGSWYPWKVVEGRQTDFKNGWNHIATVLKAVAGQSFRFCWNPYLGTGNLTKSGAESCWPGTTNIDEVGLDVYDESNGPYASSSGSSESAAEEISTVMQQKNFDIQLTEWDSIRGWYNLALSNGKTLCFPEWGLKLWRDGNVYHGGGDNAVFVNAMASFITGAANGMWHGFWEDPWGAGVYDPDTTAGRPVKAPMARGAFLNWFGQ